MDIYRFFHPHHNPRLQRTPIRQHELSELEQAAAELRKALERACQRVRRSATPPIMPEHFTDVIKAADFIERSMKTLCAAHPGDAKEVLLDLVEERRGFSGWEGWASILFEQISGTPNKMAGIKGPQPTNGNGRYDAAE